MFEILPNPSLEILLMAGRATLLIGAFVVFALAFIRWRRSDETYNEQLQLQIKQTFAEMRSLHETISVMSARLEALSERTELETRRTPASTATAHRGYDMATRLARNGSGVEELITNCGIPRHEAELLIHLHGTKARDAAPVADPHPVRQQRASQSDGLPRALPRERPDPSLIASAPPPRTATRKRGSLLSVVG